MKHGWIAYSNGCRCAECREDHRRRCAEERAKRRERIAADPSLARHGLPCTYGNWGCRCRPCKDAHAARMRARRRAGGPT